MDKYNLPNDPIARPASIVAGDNYRFTLINETVLRYEWSEDGQFEDRASAFALNRNFPTPEFTVLESDDYVEIRTPSFHVTYNRKRFDRYGLIVSFNNKNTLWGADWRYGETPENLGGTARTLDGVDGRCELGPGILSRAGYSVLDDSESMLFDGKGFVAPRKQGDRIDGYLFCYGFDYKKAMSSFHAVSGKQPSLPRWALGNWWSRYYAYSDREYLALMDKFKKEAVPLSVAVIDMDWHQVQGDHIPHAGWTGYTWEQKLFPDPKTFCDALHSKGLKITLNDHPHAGVHHHEDMYEEMAKFLGHDTSSKAPILFNPTDPKFMHAYLNILHRKLEHDGCNFWWVDWQQGPYSRVPGLDPLWLLNHFHFLDSKLENDDKGIVFSRYGGPGSHRYPVGFSGDSVMTWESLEFQPEFTATASNIGYGWWSHDIGGHYGGYRDDELATRWVQLGVFSPIMRLHSMNSLWASKEPWLYRAEHAAVMQTFLQLRHRLVPYLYTLNAVSPHNDEPLVQPLYWKFPVNDKAYQKPNQYYFGPDLFVAPIVKPRDPRTNLANVDVWVPPGRHVDVMTGLVYDGDREIRMYRGLSAMPVLAAEGAIIPLDKNLAPDNGCQNPLGFEVLIVVGKSGAFIIWEEIEDDPRTSGEKSNTHRDIHVNFDQEKGQVEFLSAGKEWSFKFLAMTKVPSDFSVTANGSAVDGVQTEVTDYPGASGLTVQVLKVSREDSVVILDLGANPQLSVASHEKRVEHFILDAQMDNGMKDKIWAVYKSPIAATTKVGQLMALGLDQKLTDPLLELLVADSRISV